MTMPKPDKHGIYPAPTWRLSNPDYAPGVPTVSKDGRYVTIDAGTWYDYEQRGKKPRKEGR